MSLLIRAANFFRRSSDVLRAGHPTLRVRSKEVDITNLNSNDVKNTIKLMKQVLTSPIYNVVGLAAPQIGINSRIIGYKIDKYAAQNSMSIDPLTLKDLKEVPITFLINPSFYSLDFVNSLNVVKEEPKIKENTKSKNDLSNLLDIQTKSSINNIPSTENETISTSPTNSTTIKISVDYESCECVPTYNAIVKRHDKIRVTGYSPEGKFKSFECNGLLSRIIQHEIDHLNGILFTDRMESKTLRHEKYSGIYQANTRYLN